LFFSYFFHFFQTRPEEGGEKKCTFFLFSGKKEKGFNFFGVVPSSFIDNVVHVKQTEEKKGFFRIEDHCIIFGVI